MSRTPRRPDRRTPPTARRSSRRPGPPAVAASWLEMPWPLRILRAFLGVTFVYAGVQKILDPGFFHVGGATYIGTQLQGFGVNTPAAPLMRLLGHAPVLTGIGVALTEIAVGVAVLFGVGLIAAATVGLAINVVLWLSATWHVHPYFIGSDSIYAVAWLALVVGAWQVQRDRSVLPSPSLEQRIDAFDRRSVLRGALVAGAALAVATIADAFAAPPTTSDRAAGLGGSVGRSEPSSRPSPSTSPSASSPAPAGRTIATLNQLPVGKAIGFTAPGVGPAALVRLSDGSVVAYSRVCTHAGCLVGYDPSAELLVCPCHGAEFDPARHAEPVPGGPTSTPLQMVPVKVDQATGDVILPA